MTSVPDWERWTIESTYRDLERVTSEVARQPGETREDVAEDLQRVLAKKRERVERAAEDNLGRPCILVRSNWSAHELSDEAYWPEENLRAFYTAILLDPKEIRSIPTK